MTYLTVGSEFQFDEFGRMLPEDGFGPPSSAGRTSAHGASEWPNDTGGGSDDAGHAGTDGLDLSGLAALGRSLAGLSAASSHDAASGLSSDALTAGLSFGAAPSGSAEIGSAGALSLDAAALKDAGADWGPGGTAFADPSHANSGSALSDFHAFGRSATPFGASAVSFAGDASRKTDFAASGASAASGISVADAKGLSNLDAADTFHFVSDLGKVPVWSGPQGDAHYDLSGHMTFDDLLGADHATLADFGPALDGLHADPLKDLAHASQHGDDFHTA